MCNCSFITIAEIIWFSNYNTVIGVAMVIKNGGIVSFLCLLRGLLAPRAMAMEGPEDEIEAVEARLERLFGSFCCFGVGKDAPALMDGTKFAKFCKDMGLIGKKLTTTDVDIIFAQSKP